MNTTSTSATKKQKIEGSTGAVAIQLLTKEERDQLHEIEKLHETQYRMKRSGVLGASTESESNIGSLSKTTTI